MGGRRARDEPRSRSQRHSWWRRRAFRNPSRRAATASHAVSADVPLGVTLCSLERDEAIPPLDSAARGTRLAPEVVTVEDFPVLGDLAVREDVNGCAVDRQLATGRLLA